MVVANVYISIYVKLTAFLQFLHQSYVTFILCYSVLDTEIFSYAWLIWLCYCTLVKDFVCGCVCVKAHLFFLLFLFFTFMGLVKYVLDRDIEIGKMGQKSWPKREALEGLCEKRGRRKELGQRG